MGGGLMQLIAYGAQDIYLTGNPEITFFKISYKRHTNFAVEPIELNVTGNSSFGSNVSCLIPKNGDLATKMYLKCDISLSGSGNFAWINRIGVNMIEEIDFLIGGSIIDRQYGNWLNIWHQLTRLEAQEKGYDVMIGNTKELTELSSNTKNATLYVPLKFFFNKFNGLAIPLVALQYHDVRVNIKLLDASKLVVKEGNSSVNLSISRINLLTNFVFLDSEERKRFANSAHEYLIEQVQFNGSEPVKSIEEIYNLNFNHPCKSLFWFIRNRNFNSGKSFLSYKPECVLKNRIGYVDNKILINEASIRFVLSKMYSSSGVVSLSLNGSGSSTASGDSSLTVYNHNSITCGLITIRANYNSLTDIDYVNNTANCSASSVSNWEVVNGLTLLQVSTPISDLYNTLGTSRTTDTNNIGHSNHDVSVYQWNNYGKFLDSSLNPVTSSLLKLNGHERFSKQNSEFFNYLQSYENYISTPNDGLNIYSFSINPIEHQPSGTCNFSRIDISSLHLEIDTDIVNIPNSEFHVFALNYNILRIMSGLGGIAYSN